MPISPQGYVLGGDPLSTNPFWDETETEQVGQVEEETHSTKAVSPQGYNLGGDPKNINPFWGEDEKTNWTIEAEATVDSTIGSPSVNVETDTDSTLKVKTFTFEFSGLKGTTGDTGNGIASITKTGASGLVDTYTILFTNGQSTTFTVTNGEQGEPGIGIQGDPGNGISSIQKTGTSGLVDTYTISFTDGTSTTFTVTNGAPGQSGSDGVGIQSITKTGTSGLVDTYTITFTNGTTTTFTVTNGTSGTDGVSPEVTIAVITGGHRVTITDADHPTGQSFDVLDGTAGTDGVTPVISATASVGTGTGTPSVSVSKTGTDAAPSFAFAFDNLKGANGATPVITMTASQNGTPITVTKTGTDAAPNFDLAFTGGGSSYNGNMAVKYTTSLSEFLTAIYNHADASQQGYPVQAYIFSNSPSGNFVFKNRYLTSDNSYSGVNTFHPAVIRAILNFDLAHTPAGGGDVHANGTLWYSGNTSNWDCKYEGEFDLNLSETNIGFRLTGGFMCYNNNDNPVGYYITRQSQNWGEYGPNINTDNVGAFRGIYLLPQS